MSIPSIAGHILVRWAVPAIGGFLFVLAAPAVAQTTLAGRVENEGSPVRDVMVVLHSVSPELAGEVDSTRVDGEGRFSFDLPGLDDQERTQIYFASVRHQGVLYFGEAIALTQQLDSVYLIAVFEAEEAPIEGFPLALSVRNVVLEQDEGSWLVTDLLRIRNDRDRTVVAQDAGSVWSHPLPSGAVDLRVGQGDLAPDAVGFEDGRVVVRAPLPPGERFLLIRYRLTGLPVDFPVTAQTEVMELLVKEPSPALMASPLQQVEAVAIEGSSYRRFTGRNLAGASVTLEETDPPVVFPVGWMSVLFGFLLTAAGLFVYHQPPDSRMRTARATPAPAAAPEQARGTIIVEIARLDERLESFAGDGEGEREALRVQRGELMDRLRATR